MDRIDTSMVILAMKFSRSPSGQFAPCPLRQPPATRHSRFVRPFVFNHFHHTNLQLLSFQTHTPYPGGGGQNRTSGESLEPEARRGFDVSVLARQAGTQSQNGTRSEDPKPLGKIRRDGRYILSSGASSTASRGHLRVPNCPTSGGCLCSKAPPRGGTRDRCSPTGPCPC